MSDTTNDTNKSPLRQTGKTLLALALYVFVFGPFRFYESGWPGMMAGLGIPLIFAVIAMTFPSFAGIQPHHRQARKFDDRLLLGLACAVSLNIFPLVAFSNRSSLAEVFSNALRWSFVIGMVSATRSRSVYSRRSFFVGLAASAILVSLAWHELQWWSLFAPPLAFLGLYMGERFGCWMKSWTAALRETWVYLRKMGPPIGGFALGYLAIAFSFAGIFAAIWRSRSASFKGLPEHPSFSDFLYYSVATITTVGYGDVLPQSTPARFFASIEMLVGLGWTIVVFAAVLTIVQKRLAPQS